MTQIRTYTEFRRLETFEDRYKYLALRGTVGARTFGYDRWINQRFYTSRQWRQVRQKVIARDLASDLGVEGHDIMTNLYIHHMNPMTVADINYSDDILEPEFLITTTQATHNAIHYGDESMLRKPLVPRSSGDTKLW